MLWPPSSPFFLTWKKRWKFRLLRAYNQRSIDRWLDVSCSSSLIFPLSLVWPFFFFFWLSKLNNMSKKFEWNINMIKTCHHLAIFMWIKTNFDEDLRAQKICILLLVLSITFRHQNERWDETELNISAIIFQRSWLTVQSVDFRFEMKNMELDSEAIWSRIKFTKQWSD